MLVNVWEFYVKPGNEDIFRLLNGPRGKWHEFFSRSPEFIETVLLTLEPVSRRYLTADLWKSEEGFLEYKERAKSMYEALSRVNRELCVKQNHLGSKWVADHGSVLSTIVAVSQPSNTQY